VPGHHPAHIIQQYNTHTHVNPKKNMEKEPIHEKWVSVCAHIIIWHQYTYYYYTAMRVVLCRYGDIFCTAGLAGFLFGYFFRRRRCCSSSSQVFFVTENASTALEQLLVNTSTTVAGHDPFPAR